MTYQDSLAYLDSLTNYERIHRPQAMRSIRLERMRLLCERLGNPQARFRSVLVAGTNGKGSMCAMIYEILRQTGLRVGLYTSPHLEDVRERIRVDSAIPARPSLHGADGSNQQSAVREGSDWISEQEFVSVIDRLRPVIEEVKNASPEAPPTYFEVLTAACFAHFFQQGVDVAVLEVGLGGRLDATNVVEPVVCVLGPIGLDHADVLGDDLVTIAREKAGIIKPTSVVISAAQQPLVLAILRELASGQGCRLIEYARHLSAEVITHSPQGMQLVIHGVRGQYDDIRLPLLGRHQAENATLAIAAVESLSEAGIPHSAVRLGLAKTFWPGRLEVIREHPLVLFDGAHNPQAAQALRMTLEELWPGPAKHLLIGMSQDKPAQAIGEILGPMASSVTCTKSRHPRACDPHLLAEQWKPYSPKAAVIPNAVDAYTYLLNIAGPNDLIVITGSLFLVGELRTAVRQALTSIPQRAMV